MERDTLTRPSANPRQVADHLDAIENGLIALQHAGRNVDLDPMVFMLRMVIDSARDTLDRLPPGK